MMILIALLLAGLAAQAQQVVSGIVKDRQTGDALSHVSITAEGSEVHTVASIVTKLEDSEIYPSYGYFVTRGLADAVKRLTRDSGLGAKIYADKIPFEGNSFALGKELDMDPVSAAMNGGDDNRLLFVVPILHLEKFRRDFQTFDIIGHMAQPEAGDVLVTPEGVEFPLKAQGWPDAE